MSLFRTALGVGCLALVAACGNAEPSSTPTSTPSASAPAGPATEPLRSPGPAKRQIELDRVIYTEVPGGTVVRARVDGTAQVFEGTVQYELKPRDKPAPAKKGFTTASTGAPGRGTFSITLTLDRGAEYTITAWQDDMATGGRADVISAPLHSP